MSGPEPCAAAPSRRCRVSPSARVLWSDGRLRGHAFLVEFDGVVHLQHLGERTLCIGHAHERIVVLANLFGDADTEEGRYLEATR